MLRTSRRVGCAKDHPAGADRPLSMGTRSARSQSSTTPVAHLASTCFGPESSTPPHLHHTHSRPPLAGGRFFCVHSGHRHIGAGAAQTVTEVWPVLSRG